MCATSRSTSRSRLWAAAAVAVLLGAPACGGAILPETGDAGTDAAPQAVPPSPVPTTTSTAPPWPTSPPTTSANAAIPPSSPPTAPNGGMSTAPVSDAGGGAACGPDIGSFVPANTPPCWPCARDMCASEAAACRVDCTCNRIVSESLACVAVMGFDLTACFDPYVMPAQMDPPLEQFGLCLVGAESACCGDGGLDQDGGFRM